MKSKLLPALGQARKAVVAAATALVGSLVTAVADGKITSAEVAVAVLTGAAAGLATFGVSNDSADLS